MIVTNANFVNLNSIFFRIHTKTKEKFFEISLTKRLL